MSPSFTSAPSLNRRCRTIPPTCGRTSAIRYGEVRPGSSVDITVFSFFTIITDTSGVLLLVTVFLGLHPFMEVNRNAVISVKTIGLRLCCDLGNFMLAKILFFRTYPDAGNVSNVIDNFFHVLRYEFLVRENHIN